MKLLFITGQLHCGGAERHLVALATGMARRGHRVTVACLKQGSELDDQLEQGGVWRRVCCHARAGLDLQALGRLVTLLDVDHPGLLVANSQYALMYAALARLRSRPPAPLAFICHSMDVVQRGAAARLRFAVYRQFYRAASCAVFVSERQRAYFARRAALPGRVDVIHNGVDLCHFAPARRNPAQDARAAFGLSPADLVVGLCAAFREEKRQDDLLAALALVRRQGLPYKALLVGEGAGRVRLEAARDRLGLQQSVHFAGFQHDVRPCIDLCDAMALTSHSETFPIATLEYMACGKAIVVSDVGGLREQFAHGQNGLLYQAGNVDALAAALALLANAGLRKRLGRAALRTVRARFDQTQMLARYEALFGALADGRP